MSGPQFRLQDLHLRFEKRGMTLVAGKFGSGKTLLLLALLGEAKLIKGKIAYAVSGLHNPDTVKNDKNWIAAKNSVAYVPQVRLYSY